MSRDASAGLRSASGGSNWSISLYNARRWRARGCNPLAPRPPRLRPRGHSHQTSPLGGNRTGHAARLARDRSLALGSPLAIHQAEATSRRPGPSKERAPADLARGSGSHYQRPSRAVTAASGPLASSPKALPNGTFHRPSEFRQALVESPSTDAAVPERRREVGGLPSR
jgi:hypothetical protein